jgi:hypothetical protein
LPRIKPAVIDDQPGVPVNFSACFSRILIPDQPGAALKNAIRILSFSFIYAVSIYQINFASRGGFSPDA